MGNQDTAVVPPIEGNQPVTPPVVETPKPDPAVELAELQRKNKELAEAISQKDSYIKTVETEKATLETRLSAVKPQEPTKPIASDIQPEMARILETAQIDPAKAGEELSRLIIGVSEKTKQELLGNLSPIIEQNTLIAKAKEDNQDLIELGLEPAITIRANQLIQSGKSFKEALDISVKETRAKVDKLKSNTPPATPPAGAQAETGANAAPLPPPTPPREKTVQEEIAERNEKRRKQGLG